MKHQKPFSFISGFTQTLATLFLAGFLSNALIAADFTLKVTTKDGAPAARVMVTLYSDLEKEGFAIPERTAFTDEQGTVRILLPEGTNFTFRARKTGFADTIGNVQASDHNMVLTMVRETDPRALAESYPANTWVAPMQLQDARFKEHFRLQCSFCHQQGSPIVRLERTEEEWEKIINRMLRYGSRLSSDAQEKLPALIRAEHLRLEANPSKIPAPRAWTEEVVGAQITEWKLGGGSSQLHDVFLSESGLIYVGDNLQDNLIELDPKTGRTVSHKIPRGEGDTLGGNIGGRLKNYPGVGTYVGLHSLDESPVDGHLFMTGSDSSRLIEFAPESGNFTLYDLPQGFYPHTIRIDPKDRVWFTMAVSNQIAMFDRKTSNFTFYDLPTRSFKEKMTVTALPLIMKLARMGMDTHDMHISEDSQGLPLPYGIDIAPDGTIWFTRLHSDEIGHIDPETGKLDMYKTPFLGPRRLRTDKNGNVWVSVFASGRLAMFNPKSEKFTLFDLPTQPLGSDTPYALAVDKVRNHVWVNGTASDTMMRFDVNKGTWAVFPLPRRRSFTRDIVVAKDGSIFTSNGSFPAWHIEDGQPTVIRITPADFDKNAPLTKSE